MPVFFVQYRLKTHLLYGIVGHLHLRGNNVQPFMGMQFVLSKIFVFQRFRVVGFYYGSWIVHWVLVYHRLLWVGSLTVDTQTCC